VSRLIQELLDQATAEGRTLDEERVELGGYDGLVHEVAELMPAGAAVEVGAVPEVFADADLVRQLLGNLLDNAVKYAAPDRPLRVSVTGVRVDDRVRIDVTDNGVGIPPEERDRVFERFHRAHAGDPRFSGTGLGLALCRTIVERHGGVIECLPTPAGIGSTFRFDLPGADPITAAAVDGSGLDGPQSPDRNELIAPATSS
jgi:signal transduction histidine kinase